MGSDFLWLPWMVSVRAGLNIRLDSQTGLSLAPIPPLPPTLTHTSQMSSSPHPALWERGTGKGTAHQEAIIRLYPVHRLAHHCSPVGHPLFFFPLAPHIPQTSPDNLTHPDVTQRLESLERAPAPCCPYSQRLP